MSKSDRPGDPSSATQAAPWAWGVCWLMFASTALNYMDRQAISIVAAPIKSEFGLSNVGFGWVMAVFAVTYAVCQVPAGLLVDRWDVRKTYAGAVAWWSFAGIAAAFSPTLGALLAFRALLGVGESFNWPCALKITGQILPPADRSLGNGIFNSGAAVGAVLTPLVVTFLTNWYGWRTSFVVVGALGLVWVLAWVLLIGTDRRAGFAVAKPGPPIDPFDLPGPPSQFSDIAGIAFGGLALLSAAVAASAFRFGLPAIWSGIALLMFGLPVVARVLPAEALAGFAPAESLGEVVRNRRFGVLVVVSVSVNVCWHFLVSWLPTYLKEDRGMTFLASGLWTAVPFLAADVGNLGGGGLSRYLAGRGFRPFQARIRVMAGCTLLIASGAAVGFVRNDLAAIALLCLMAMGAAGFMANYFAFTQEVSGRNTGLIVGYLGGLGNLCAAGFLPLAGLVKDSTGGFGPVFLLVGVLPFVGLGALFLGWDRGEAEPGN